jgi:hypothetical protein
MLFAIYIEIWGSLLIVRQGCDLRIFEFDGSSKYSLPPTARPQAVQARLLILLRLSLETSSVRNSLDTHGMFLYRNIQITGPSVTDRQHL